MKGLHPDVSIYSIHTGRTGGRGGRDCKLSHLLILHWGHSAEVLALTPRQKAGVRWSKCINDEGADPPTRRGHSLCFVGIWVIMGVHSLFLFLLQCRGMERKRGALMWKTNIHNERIKLPLATVTTMKCYRGNTQYLVTHIIRPILGALFYFSFEAFFFFFPCSQIHNLAWRAIFGHSVFSLVPDLAWCPR